jgi:hypothetical protein
MKQIVFIAVLGLTLLSNSVFAQKTKDAATEANPTWNNKLYSQMGYDEKLRFVAAKSDEILSLFGRTKGDEINAESLQLIRTYLEGYLKRISKPKLDSCSAGNAFRNDLTSVLQRGRLNASLISEEFAGQKLPPQVGIYVAMLETEFCPCLQAPTGALGMFQLTKVVGEIYGLKTQTGATPTNPDERCEPRLAARAASKYFRKMIDDIFGADAVGFPLAIGAYNRGEGSTKKHITEAAAISSAPRISFWVLIETKDELLEKLEKDSAKKTGDENETAQTPFFMRQFEAENIKYVPKFFAAAIIGENPKTFGLNMPPLSQAK